MYKATMPAWLPLALASIFWWGLFGFLAKLGADQLPATQLYLFFVIGMIPLVALAMLRRRGKLETDRRGAGYGILNGIFSGLGLLAYYAAMEAGKASVVGPVTSLYPLVTVVLALALLKESLNAVQRLGVGLAISSIVILSLS
jgi:transporter family protein